jgi:molecular chaperone HscB
MTADSNIQITACWSCRGAVRDGNAFCETCGAVQPPGQVDHFARFGLEPAFDVDGQDVQQRYFSLQQQLHPDRFAGKSERERAISMQQSTSINQAFEVLNAPLARAEYLLGLTGITVNAETGNLPTDPEVLAEAMETREALMDADDEAAVAALAEDVGARAEACLAELSAAFGAGDTGRAATLATRLKYLEKFADEVRRRRATMQAAP